MLPTKSAATVPMPRSAAATAVTSAQPTSIASSGRRWASRRAGGASRPKHRTGSVVSSPASVADSPRSSRMSGSSGGRLAITVRRLRPRQTIASSTAGR